MFFYVSFKFSQWLNNFIFTLAAIDFYNTKTFVQQLHTNWHRSNVHMIQHIHTNMQKICLLWMLSPCLYPFCHPPLCIMVQSNPNLFACFHPSLSICFQLTLSRCLWGPLLLRFVTMNAIRLHACVCVYVCRRVCVGGCRRVCAYRRVCRHARMYVCALHVRFSILLYVALPRTLSFLRAPLFQRFVTIPTKRQRQCVFTAWCPKPRWDTACMHWDTHSHTHKGLSTLPLVFMSPTELSRWTTS